MICSRLTPLVCAILSILISHTPTSSMAKEPQQYTEHTVRILAGDITLGASLFRPSKIQGDLPAIVTAHGSAPSTRDGVSFYTMRALEMGFAVLSFDKRGTGESSGKYEPFNVKDSPRTFDDLAMDVVWSVRWLAEQKGIDASRIGLFGGSQAGWIMPLAASKEPLIKFIVIGEGVPLTAGEEAIHESYLMENARTAESFDQLPISQADEAVYNYNGEAGYDPMPVLRSVDIPILWIFGLRDWVIPVAPSINRLEGLIKAGKVNNSIHVFPFGDHNFLNTATGQRYDVVKVVEPWLRNHGFLHTPTCE